MGSRVFPPSIFRGLTICLSKRRCKVPTNARAGAVTVVCVGVGLAGYSAYWFLKKTAKWGEDAKDLWNMTFGATPEVLESIKQGKGPQVSNPNTGPFTPLYRWVGGLFS